MRHSERIRIKLPTQEVWPWLVDFEKIARLFLLFGKPVGLTDLKRLESAIESGGD